MSQCSIADNRSSPGRFCFGAVGLGMEKLQCSEGGLAVHNVRNIGLLGCGVVGGGVVSALSQNRDHLLQHCGVSFDIVKIAVRDLERSRVDSVQREWLCDNWRDVCEHPEIDIVIEAMGGVDPAFEAVKTALERGKHVITANKELLATYGRELYAIAQANGVTVLCEASALGGVPVLHALDHYFAANRIQKVTAIANGTSNYILTRMREDRVTFAEALAEAQQAGYAEADPSFDVLGQDARFKLQILCRSAFATEVATDDIECVGIPDVDTQDMEVAESLGCRIRLVATAEDDGEVLHASVRPVLVPAHHPLYAVDGVNNALCVDADIVGQVVYAGPGAGSFATASAIVEDLVRLATTANQPRCVHTRVKPVHPVRYPAYLVVHRRYTSHRVGPYTVPFENTALASVDYVGPTSLGVECWVIQGERAHVEQWTAHLAGLCHGEVRWYPFVEAPKAYPAGLPVQHLDASLRFVAAE
ncbi:homoserine dehydrogenase [Alicyclobacillus pomorum]